LWISGDETVKAVNEVPPHWRLFVVARTSNTTPGFVDFESIARRADGADPSNDKGSGAGYLEARGRSGHAVVVSFACRTNSKSVLCSMLLTNPVPASGAGTNELSPMEA
jgi:hypothetical protein